MKKLTINNTILILVISLFVVSCSDFLDREPQGRYTLDNYPGGGLTEFVYGMYSELRSYGIHAFPYVGIFSITSDDADKGSTPAE